MIADGHRTVLITPVINQRVRLATISMRSRAFVMRNLVFRDRTNSFAQLFARGRFGKLRRRKSFDRAHTLTSASAY